MQFSDRKEGIFVSAYWTIPYGDAFAVQPAELVVVLAKNFCPQKLTAKAARQGEAKGRIKSTLSGWKPSVKRKSCPVR